MSFKSALFAGAAMLGGLTVLQMPYALAATATSANMPPQEQHAVDNAQPNRIELQITELHNKLNLIPAQEERWGEVAEAMRDTAKEVRTKLTERAEKVKTAELTAVDELRSYRDLQQVQYDGAKRLLEPFEKLYGDMSPAQKRNADEVFEQPRARAEAGGGTGHRSDTKAPADKSQ